MLIIIIFEINWLSFKFVFSRDKGSCVVKLIL